MGMQEWNIESIRKGIKEIFTKVDGFGVNKVKANVEQFFIGTTDDHIFDVFGTSKAKKKTKALKLWCIKINKKGFFEQTRVNVLYGGEVTIMEEFLIENEELEEDLFNQKYKDVIKDFEKKAEDYNSSLDRDLFDYYRRAYVVVERNSFNIPIVKWIVFEHRYYEEHIQLKKNERWVENIRDVEGVFLEDDYEESDVYQIVYWDWENYYMPEYLTMLYVKADVYFTMYDGSVETHCFEGLYDNCQDFLNEYRQIEQNFTKKNTRIRWQKQSGMDIDKMNELSKILMMEHYLLNGLTKFDNNKVKELGKHGEDYREFLTSLQSLEEYLNVLNSLMIGYGEEKIRKAFLEIRDNPSMDLENLFMKFLNNYLGNGYEIGKIYLAKAKEEVSYFSEESQIADVIFHKKEGYITLKSKMLEQRDFMDMVIVKLGEIVPFKVIGFKEDGSPIAEYAGEWYFSF